MCTCDDTMNKALRLPGVIGTCGPQRVVVDAQYVLGLHTEAERLRGGDAARLREVERQRDAANAGWQAAAKERDQARAEVNALSDRLAAMGAALAKASGLAPPRPSVRPYAVPGDVTALFPPQVYVDRKPVNLVEVMAADVVVAIAAEKAIHSKALAEIRRQLNERIDLNDRNARAHVSRDGHVSIDSYSCRARADAYAVALGIVDSVEKTFVRSGA